MRYNFKNMKHLFYMLFGYNMQTNNMNMSKYAMNPICYLPKY